MLGPKHLEMLDVLKSEADELSGQGPAGRARWGRRNRSSYNSRQAIASDSDFRQRYASIRTPRQFVHVVDHRSTCHNVLGDEMDREAVPFSCGLDRSDRSSSVRRLGVSAALAN